MKTIYFMLVNLFSVHQSTIETKEQLLYILFVARVHIAFKIYLMQAFMELVTKIISISFQINLQHGVDKIYLIGIELSQQHNNMFNKNNKTHLDLEGWGYTYTADFIYTFIL